MMYDLLDHEAMWLASLDLRLIDVCFLMCCTSFQRPDVPLEVRQAEAEAASASGASLQSELESMCGDDNEVMELRLGMVGEDEVRVSGGICHCPFRVDASVHASAWSTRAPLYLNMRGGLINSASTAKWPGEYHRPCCHTWLPRGQRSVTLIFGTVPVCATGGKQGVTMGCSSYFRR
jgi:hypothetical protein